MGLVDVVEEAASVVVMVEAVRVEASMVVVEVGAEAEAQILDLGSNTASQLVKGELVLCARAQIPEKKGYTEGTNLPLHVAYRALRSRGVLVSASMADVSSSCSPTSSSGS
jgi:hypothetical protein